MQMKGVSGVDLNFTVVVTYDRGGIGETMLIDSGYSLSHTKQPNWLLICLLHDARTTHVAGGRFRALSGSEGVTKSI
jgi:hypothetical protein